MRIESITEWPEDLAARQRLARRKNASRLAVAFHRAHRRRAMLCAALACVALAGAGLTKLLMLIGWIHR